MACNCTGNCNCNITFPYLKGDPGAAGSVWRDGSGVPSNGLGVNGDYYLDDATGNVYKKASGAYSIVANIKGASGTAGTTILYSNVTNQVCSTGTANETLNTYSLLANTLPANGDFIIVEGFIKGIQTSGTPNLLDINVSLAGNVIATIQGINPVLGTLIDFKFKIFRATSTSFKQNVLFLGMGQPIIASSTSFTTSTNIDFTTNMSLTLNIVKNGLNQVSGDFAITNYDIVKFLQ